MFLIRRCFSTISVQFQRSKMEWAHQGGRVVHFQHVPSTDTVQIYLQYSNPALKVDRTFNFSRKVSEGIDAFLNRVQTNLEKVVAKKSKKKKTADTVPTEEAPPLRISLNSPSGNPVEDVSTMGDLLERLDAVSRGQQTYSLAILDDSYEIQVNRPWVSNLQMPTSILAGYYVYPNRIELLFCHRDDLQFTWWRDSGSAWSKVGEGFSYLVSNDDVSHKLKLRCSPKGDSDGSGLYFERVANCVVQAGPGMCPFEERHLYTPHKLTGNKFRVISYNILADLYADSNYSNEVLFSYCQKYALNMDYRKQLFIKEILGYRGDIICMQEVDAKIFDLDLEPILKENGFSGHFAEKREVGEGEAIFYDSARFELLQKYQFDVGENLKGLEIFKEINEKLQRNERLFNRIVDRPTTLMVLALRSRDNPGQVLVVANTHLYFHPDADHIRLLQAGLCVLYIENVILEEVRKHHVEPSDKISIIFAGDFNSDPKSGIFELMTQGSIGTDYKDWSSSKYLSH